MALAIRHPGRQVAGERALAGVQVQGADAVAVAHQADDDVDGGGGFAGAAFLVAKDDDGGAGVSGDGRHGGNSDSVVGGV